MNYNFDLLNRINEARVERTIDPKLWASVSSACSKTYKNDLGKTAKPIGTREQLLQRFVAGLIILKQQCPITEKDMRDCPAFPLWANKLMDMGVKMEEIHKLWNENCGKLPKVEATMNTMNTPESDITDEDEDDDVITGISIDDDDLDDSDNIQLSNMIINDTENQPSIEYVDEPNEEQDEDEPAVNTLSSQQTPTFKKEEIAPTATYSSDPYTLIDSIHKLLFGKGSQFSNLHGCSVPTEAMKFIPKLTASAEGITPCDNLDDLLNMNANIYALRVFKGGNPEEVTGDVIWCESKTDTSYYVGVSPEAVAIYYKDVNGDFTLAWKGNHADFGFIS